MFKDPEFITKDYAIGGKLCGITTTISDLDMLHADPVYIKNQLASYLAKFILEQKLVEFTQKQDLAMGTTKVYARVYLAPDDQVRIVRMIK